MSQTANDQHVFDFLAEIEREHRGDVVRPRRKRNRMTDFFAGLQQDRIAGGRGAGGFAGGKIDRFNEEWNPGSAGPNRVFAMDGRLIRERAWDLFRNNPYARSAVNSYIENVIECGIKPKPRYADRERRRSWERAWDRWGGVSVHSTNEADLSGVQTIYGLQALWLTEQIVGGGCLMHFIETSRRHRTVPLAIELIPEERFADDVLQSGPNSKTANPVQNGVEVNPLTGRHLAYHVRRTHPDDLTIDLSREPQRIPADRARYSFARERIGGHRGMTLFKTAIIWLWSLGYYVDAELVAADLKSSWAYMIKTDAAAQLDWPDLSDSDPETGATDIFGNQIEKVEKGMIWRGAPGDEVDAVGPNVPGSDSVPWILLIQMSIAIGLGLSYQELLRDYGKANFAAARMTRNRDKKTFRPLQTHVVQDFLNPTIVRFTEQGARAGLDGFPRPAEYIANSDEFLDIAAKVPGWESANPREDAIADDIALANGSTDLQRIAERTGDDWETALERQAQVERRRQELERQHGVTLPRPGESAADHGEEPAANANSDGETTG